MQNEMYQSRFLPIPFEEAMMPAVVQRVKNGILQSQQSSNLGIESQVDNIVQKIDEAVDAVSFPAMSSEEEEDLLIYLLTYNPFLEYNPFFKERGVVLYDDTIIDNLIIKKHIGVDQEFRESLNLKVWEALFNKFSQEGVWKLFASKIVTEKNEIGRSAPALHKIIESKNIELFNLVQDKLNSGPSQEFSFDTLLKIKDSEGIDGYSRAVLVGIIKSREEQAIEDKTETKQLVIGGILLIGIAGVYHIISTRKK